MGGGGGGGGVLQGRWKQSAIAAATLHKTASGGLLSFENHDSSTIISVITKSFHNNFILCTVLPLNFYFHAHVCKEFHSLH